MYSRKLYEAIAEIVRECTYTQPFMYTDTEMLIKDLSKYFKKTNPRFDEAKFREAITALKSTRRIYNISELAC